MTIQHCIECGEELSQKSNTAYKCANNHFYYNNARAAVVILLVQNNKILFARRANNPFAGKLDLPGGFVDPRETLEEATKREAKEELGIDIKQLHYVTSNPNTYTENTFTCDSIFLATEWVGDISPADDVANVEWHPLSAMIDNDFAWANWSNLYERLEKFIDKN